MSAPAAAETPTTPAPRPIKLLSYFEIRAYDAKSLGLVIQAASGSASNLVERRVGTYSSSSPMLSST